MKNKIIRFFRSFNPGGVGAFASMLCVIQLLLELGIEVAANQISGVPFDMMSLLFAVINIIFYLSISKYFLRSKNENNLAILTYPILVLTFFNYIMPIIQLVLNGLLTGNLGAAMLGTLTSSSIFGVLYFVFIILWNKGIFKYHHLFLMTFGAIILITSSAYSIMNLINVIEVVMVNPELINILFLIEIILQVLVYIAMGIVYVTYPILRNRNDKLGY